MKLNQTLVITITTLLVFTTACRSSTGSETPSASNSTQEASGAIYQTLTIDAFADILRIRADEYKIINVHIPYEGEVANTDANIPYNDLNALTAALPDKNARIILYCRSGRMSAEASLALSKLGYTQIWDVPGGMNAWQSAGRQLLEKTPGK